MREIHGVSVRRVKVLERASEETLCFQADVYVNGRKLGVVTNDGRGGCNRYTSAALEKALVEAAAKLPRVVDPTKPDFDDPSKPYSYQPDADNLIMRLVDFAKAEGVLSRALKKYVVTTTGGDKFAKYGPYQTEALARAVTGGEVALRALARPRPGERVLNHLPIDDAVDLILGPSIEDSAHG